MASPQTSTGVISLGGQYYGLGIKDGNGNYALAHTPFYQTPAGILIPAPTDQNGNPQVSLAGGLVTDEVLLNDVSATGAGTEISVGGNAKIEVEVYGAGTGYSLVAQLIMTNGSGQPVSTQAFSLVSQSMVQNITENGGYEIDCAGWDKVLLNVETAPTGGTISASGKLVASA